MTRPTQLATTAKSRSASVWVTTPSSSSSKAQQPSSPPRARNLLPPLPSPSLSPLPLPLPCRPRPRIRTNRPIRRPSRQASRQTRPHQQLLQAPKVSRATITRPPSTRHYKGQTQRLSRVHGCLDTSRATQAQSLARPLANRFICEVAPPPLLPLCLHFPSLSHARPSPLIQFLQQR